MLHGHGDDGYKYQKHIVADFSTNVWYGGEPGGLKEHLLARWHTVNRYPEVLGERLVSTLAIHHGLSSANFLVNNGSTESIYLIAQAFEKSKTAIVVPAFAEYEDACRMYGHNLSFVHWEELQQLPEPKPEVLFLCNPNNPTGEIFAELESLISSNPQTTFVLDEAFIEFTTAIKSAIPLIKKHPNLLILRSLTKAYAIPGLRLGYIIAADALIEKLKSLKYPWSVNTLALEAGKYIFDNYQKIQIPLAKLLQEKERFAAELQKLSFKVHKSHTHFFLAETPKATASELKQFLIDNFGILIRDASNFRTLGSQFVRLATLNPEKNNLLTGALEEWMNGNY